jgi:hypothetical protein
MDRHEDLPELQSSRFNQMRFNVKFTAETLVPRTSRTKEKNAHQRLTMATPRSSKINATGQNGAERATW